MSTVAVQRASTDSALTHNLYDYMNKLYDKVAKRAFSFFERDGCNHGHDLEHWLEAESEFLSPMLLQVSETGTDLTIRAEVPGFTEKELEIVAEPGRLFITGKREKRVKDQKKKTLYSEIVSYEIFRSISFPVEIDPEKVSANLRNGVLEVSMHKSEPAKKVMAIAKAA